jgi:hypothetical protein
MEGTLIVAQPIRMASDSPIFILEFDDGHPYSGGIFREKGLAFGEHNDLCEVLYDVLLGKPVKTWSSNFVPQCECQANCD